MEQTEHTKEDSVSNFERIMIAININDGYISVYNNNINLCSLQETYKHMDKKDWKQTNDKKYISTKH